MNELDENSVKETETEETGAENKLSFTQEELDAMMASYADKRVSQALKTVEKKHEAKLKESEKLAKMNATEKYEYELEQRERAILEKERELALAENKNEASKILAERGLDLSLVEFVVAEDAQTMNDNISLLDKAFKKSVKSEVERRLAGNTPKRGLPMEKAITKEEFMKMSLSEMLALKEQNPELYSQLSK